MDFTVAITARAFLDYAQGEMDRLVAAGCTIGRTAEGPLTRDRLLEILDGADAVICSTDPYVDEVLSARPQLKHIARWGAGYESVDLAAATKHGVIATRVVGCVIDAVADHAFALMLGISRRLVEGDAAMRSGQWQPLQGASVFGATLGIIGFGPIGRAVAQRAHGFQMRVLVHDPYVDGATVREAGGEPAALDELLAESDFVTLHCAQTPETRGIIDGPALSKMKPSAYLLNTGRGGLVDEAALLRALHEGRIAGAGLDTYATEPLPPEAPIRDAPRTLLMPHSAFNTLESALSVSAQVCDQVLATAAGRCPANVLNPEVLQSPVLRAALRE